MRIMQGARVSLASHDDRSSPNLLPRAFVYSPRRTEEAPITIRRRRDEGDVRSSQIEIRQGWKGSSVAAQLWRRTAHRFEDDWEEAKAVEARHLERSGCAASSTRKSRGRGFGKDYPSYRLRLHLSSRLSQQRSLLISSSPLFLPRFAIRNSIYYHELYFFSVSISHPVLALPRHS